MEHCTWLWYANAAVMVVDAVLLYRNLSQFPLDRLLGRRQQELQVHNSPRQIGMQFEGPGAHAETRVWLTMRTRNDAGSGRLNGGG